MHEYNFDRRFGDNANPYELPEEKEERLRQEKIRAIQKFIASIPSFRPVVHSEYEYKVRALEARIADGKFSLQLLKEMLNPATHIAENLEEYGPILGILPAALSAVLKLLLRGIPEAVIMGPQDIYKIFKNKDELDKLVKEKELSYKFEEEQKALS